MSKELEELEEIADQTSMKTKEKSRNGRNNKGVIARGVKGFFEHTTPARKLKMTLASRHLPRNGKSKRKPSMPPLPWSTTT